MPADYTEPTTVPIVAINDTTHVGVAYYGRRPAGYRGRHRADRKQQPNVRLVLDHDNNGGQ